MLPAYILSHHLPPPPTPPTLTVTARGCLYPSKALLLKLGLRKGQLLDLLPPSVDCPSWQLDVRPTAGRRITWYDNTPPRVEGLRLPAGLLAPGMRLTLALTLPAPSSAGRYVLRAVAA